MAVSVPLVLVLWEHPNFGGIKRTIIKDRDNIGWLNFNDKTSSIGVHVGPSYDPSAGSTVSVFQHPDYKGPEAVLGPGTYRNISSFGFNDNISSVRFNTDGRAPGVNRDGLFQPIVPGDAPAAFPVLPLIVDLVADIGGQTRLTTLLESSPRIESEYGSDLNDTVFQVGVSAGPGFAGHKVRVHRDPNYIGGYLEFAAGFQDTLWERNFAGVISSVEIVDSNGARWPR